jgi:hypothetical protein
MRSKWAVLVTLVLVGAASWVLSGCSDSPIAPASLDSPSTASSLPSSPEILTVSSDGTVHYTLLPSGYVSLARGSGGQTSSASASAKIDGRKGGSLRCERFSILVPPGAYSGTATITMYLPNKDVLACDLSISPSSANNFVVPVQLGVDLKGMNVDPSTVVIYWYNPTTLTWVSQLTMASSSPAVTALLSHFSTYAAGKAGW